MTVDRPPRRRDPVRMDFTWLILYALGGVVAFYALAVVVILIIAAIKPGGDGEGTMRFVSGETIFVPREPEPPRKRWRITIERR
jgi:hypothetical protein